MYFLYKFLNVLYRIKRYLQNLQIFCVTYNFRAVSGFGLKLRSFGTGFHQKYQFCFAI